MDLIKNAKNVQPAKTNTNDTIKKVAIGTGAGLLEGGTLDAFTVKIAPLTSNQIIIDKMADLAFQANADEYIIFAKDKIEKLEHIKQSLNNRKELTDEKIWPNDVLKYKF